MFVGKLARYLYVYLVKADGDRIDVYTNVTFGCEKPVDGRNDSVNITYVAPADARY